MPIVVPDKDNDPLYRRLAESGATLIGESAALSQDIRPARIGLLNLMPAPAMTATEVQWLRHISRTVLQIEPVLIKFDDDPRDVAGRSREKILQRYLPFSRVVSDGLDGMIVTGDNVELRDKDVSNPKLLPFEEIFYYTSLVEILDWARVNVYSTIYSCLASHFALSQFFGLERQLTRAKTFGVFDHEINRNVLSPYTRDVDDSIRAPHSRWGEIPTKYLEDANIEVLASCDEAGWLLAQSANSCGGRDLYIQGHPEYNRDDLMSEYLRDKLLALPEPMGYFENGQPRLTWENDARALHANWVGDIYEHFSHDS